MKNYPTWKWIIVLIIISLAIIFSIPTYVYQNDTDNWFLKNKINLGLDIGSSDVLSEFSDVTKSRNFSFSIGSDILKNVLSFKKARNDIFKILNKSNLAKNIIFDVADKGLRF